MKINGISLVLIIFFVFGIINANYEDLQKVLNHETTGCVDLSYDSLSYQSFSFCSLSLSSLYCTNLMCTKFYGANLFRTDLRKATFDRTNFNRAYLYEAYMSDTKLNDSCFVGANLSGANLTGADMSKSDFTNAKLCNTKLKDAILFVENEYEEIIQGAIVKGADFAFAKGLTDKQKKYLFDHGAIHVPWVIVYELEEYENKEVFDPKKLSYIERIKRYFKNKYIHKFKSKNCGIQKFEEDLEDYDKEVFDPKLLDYKERIKRYFRNKYKWFLKSKNQEVQTD